MRFFQNIVSAVCSLTILLSVFSSGSIADTNKDFSVVQLREISYQHSPAIRVRFSEAVDLKTIVGKVDLVHSRDGVVQLTDKKYSFVLGEDDSSVIFPFVEPSTEYQVLANASLQSASGKYLGNYYAEKIVTKRLSAQANFSSTGYLMPLSGQKTLPVTVTNVDEVDVRFYHVPADKYDVFLKSNIDNGTEYNYQLNRFVEQTEFIYTSRFSLSPKRNQRTFVNLDVSHVTEINDPGLYVAVMSKAGRFDNSHSVIHFTVSDLAVHLREYKHKSVVHVMNLLEGSSESDVKLEIYDKNGNVLSSNLTDKNGVGEVVLQQSVSAAYLIASKQNNITILPLNRSKLDLSDFDNATSVHSDIQAFSFGPRDLFRPGETAQLQILLRDYDGQQLSNIPLSLTLTRPDGQVVQNAVIQPEAAGYYQFNYQLSQQSQTGQWKVTYQAAGQKLNQNYYFKVEDFRPNRLELEQFVKQTNLYVGDKDKRLLANKDKLENTVSGKYLFGAKATGNKVDGMISATFDRHPLPEYNNYFFGDESESLRLKNRHVSSIKLDHDGEGEIAINNPWRHFKSPIRLTYTLSLYDGGGQPTTSVEPVTLIKGKGLVGIKPDFSGEPDKNSKVGFSIISLSSDFQTSESDSLTISLVKEDRNYYWSHDQYRGWQFKYDASPYEVWQSTVVTGSSGEASIEVPIDFGHYQLIVTNKSRAITSTYNFKTAGRWWSNSRESKNKPDAILMSFGKDNYAPGDQAELSYFAPHSGRAWLTVENNNGLLYQQNFDVTEGENTVNIDVAKEWSRHDNYATLMIVKNDDKQQATRTRAFGMVHLPVKRANMALDIELTAPDTSLPLRKVTSQVSVSNPQNLAGETYAVAALVDVGILNITKYRSPKPEKYFLAPRRYEVELADVYDKLIGINDGKTLAQRFGGDLVESDDELARGGKKPDADVELLSLLSKPVKLDENGKAQISFELPEFAGKLRWAVVVFNENQFGSAEQFTKVSSPFVSQLSSPYFLAPKDKSVSVLEVHNTTKLPQELTVIANTSGGLTQVDLTRSFSLAPNSKDSLSIELTSDGSLQDGFVSYVVENSTSEQPYKIERQHKIPVRPAYPAITTTEYFSLAEGESWKLDAADTDHMPGSLQGQLTLSSTPPIALAEYFDSLLAYPYGCLEQTSSRALPWLYTDNEFVERYNLDAYVQSRMKETYSENLRVDVLNKAIEQLKQKQRSDGSFSLWSGASNEYSWLTVYATDIMVDAAKGGIQVPTQMLDKAINVLRKYLRRPSSIKVNSWSNGQEFYRNLVRAYAAYVLAKANRASLSDLRRFGNAMVKANVSGTLPWAHLAASFKILGAEKDTQITLNRMAVGVRPMGYIGDYGSEVRDLAWTYALSIQYGFDLTLDFVRLRNAINERRWLSTQDKARLFAFASLLNDEDKFDADIGFEQGKSQLVSDRSRFNALLDELQVSSLNQVSATNGTVYGRFATSYSSVSAPQSKLDEIDIEKMFYDLEGYPTTLEAIKSGQLVIVELTLTSAKNIKDALVVDLLPAGLLIENQNLSHASVSLSSLEVEGEAVKQPKSLAHQEFREDRYVAALELRKQQTEKLYYLVRATALGSYTVPATYVEDMFNPEIHGIGESSTLNVNE